MVTKTPLALLKVLQPPSRLISNQESLKWYSRFDEGQLYNLLNRSPNSSGGGGFASNKSRFLLVCSLADWPFSKIPNSRMWPFLTPTVRVSLINTLLLVTQPNIRCIIGAIRSLHYSWRFKEVMWRNSSHRRKWIPRPEFKSWSRLHFALTT